MIPKHLPKTLVCGMMFSCIAGLQAVTADRATAEQAQTEKMGGLSGIPVNSAISGGSLVPKSLLLTALNFSYRDKDDIVDDKGFGARTLESELYLLKLRYGLTDRVELAFVPGYVSNHRDSFGPLGSDHIDGPTDFFLGCSYALFSQRLGDPLSMALTLGVNMPTGQEGSDRLPGGDVWSYNAKIGITKVWYPNHRIDWDMGITQPTETGNLGVKKDTTWTMTGSYHYVFNPNFDIGLEFTVDNSQDWERNGINMKNGSTEIYVGPTANYVLPQWNMWFGAGVFFPVMRDYDVATASDDVRMELKLGKVWSF